MFFARTILLHNGLERSKNRITFCKENASKHTHKQFGKTEHVCCDCCNRALSNINHCNLQNNYCSRMLCSIYQNELIGL